MSHNIKGPGERSKPGRPSLRTLALTLATAMPVAASLPAAAQETIRNQPGWLDTITVAGTRTETSIKDNPASVSVVDEEQLERQPPASIADLVRDVPGVEVIDASAPGMQRLRIRGESSNRVTILVDGQEITDHSDYGTPILVDPANVERIEVIRGPASVLYGAKAIGGVVNIITKRGASRPIQLELGGSYFSGTKGWQGWAAVSGTVGDFDYRLSGSADRHHDRVVPKGQYTDTGRLDGSSYRNSDVSLHLGYTFGESRNHYLALKAEQHNLSTESWTDPAYLTGSTRAFNIDLPKRDLRKVGLYYDAKDLSPVVRKIHLDAYHQTVDRLFENRVEVQTATVVPPMSINVKNTATSDDRNLNYGGTAQIDLALHPDHYTIAGMQYLMDDLDAAKNSFTTTRITLPSGTMTTSTVNPIRTSASLETASLFAQDEWTFAQNFKLTAGLRYYHVRARLGETTNASLVDPGDTDTNRLVKSLGLTWSGLAHTTLRALYSEGYTMPNLSQMYTDTSAGGYLSRGNPNLKPETSQNYELGARYQHAGLILDAAAFYTQAKDYISTATCASVGTCPASAGANDRTYTNINSADTHGVELIAEYALPGTNFTPYATGAWTQRKLKYPTYSTTNSGVPAFSGRVGVRYDTELYGTQAWADLFVRAATAIEQTYLSNNVFETDRLPGWGTLNLAFGGSRGKERKVSMGVHFNNILNKEYRSAFDALPGVGRSVEVTFRTTF
uniref:TonB-dependent receptor plug domain-containing protein n=1 Tax=Castellaniella defragrans TaxID=75697 RepID=UPI0033412262